MFQTRSSNPLSNVGFEELRMATIFFLKSLNMVSAARKR